MMRQIEMELAKREKSKQINQPWWVKPIASAVANIPVAQQQAATFKYEQYGRELLAQQRFDARLSMPMMNALSDESMYTNKGIDELEANLTRIKNEDMKRFPNQSADFIDIYDKKINKLKEYRSLNNHYNYFTSYKIPETEKLLLDITEELSGLDWDDLYADDADKKLELKERLYKGTQEISEFKKFMKNNADYFSNNRSFSADNDRVNINLIGGYNQLLKQINTFDPMGTIISEDEQRMMIQSIRDGNPDEIRGRNETIASAANSRQQGYQDQFTNAYSQHVKNTIVVNSPDFQKAAATMDENAKEKHKEYEKGDITLKEYIDWVDDPLNWQFPLPEDGTLINVSEVRKNQVSLEQMMDEADANFEKETGSKYSEWMGKRTPWRKSKEELDLDREAQLKEDVKKILPSGKLPDVGVGVTPTGEESFAVSELHKPVTPEVPTMPAGEPRKFSEWNNPGNLKFANQTDATGKTPTGFATFDTPDSGWQALYNQIEADKGRNDTLKQFIYGKGDGDYGYTATDREVYLKNLSKELNLSPNAKIDTVSTEKLANAIAKQEGWKGDFPKAKEPKPKVDEYTLYKIDDGKPVVPSTSKPFIKAQSNLASVVSDKFSKLSASEKNKYKGSKKEATQQFVKDKFEKWLRKSGRYGKPYAEGDYKYFFKTKDYSKRVWYPGAFKRASLLAEPSDLSPLEYAKERIDLIYSPDVVATDAGYAKFAKDFDAFRKFLQES